MTFYPAAIQRRLGSPANSGEALDGVQGVSASLTCGSFVTISVTVDTDRASIKDAKLRTNGCGFMIAAADLLCDWLRNKTLAELHGLNDNELSRVIGEKLGRFPADRLPCASTVFEALRNAMALHRSQRIEEFQGEKALICTCFGVSEESIVTAIAENGLTDVDDVSGLCRAGSGCGSCRFLIQELIDVRGTEMNLGRTYEGRRKP